MDEIFYKINFLLIASGLCDDVRVPGGGSPAAEGLRRCVGGLVPAFRYMVRTHRSMPVKNLSMYPIRKLIPAMPKLSAVISKNRCLKLSERTTA